jgi:hypothetical protein
MEQYRGPLYFLQVSVDLRDSGANLGDEFADWAQHGAKGRTNTLDGGPQGGGLGGSVANAASAGLFSPRAVEGRGSEELDPSKTFHRRGRQDQPEDDETYHEKLEKEIKASLEIPGHPVTQVI